MTEPNFAPTRSARSRDPQFEVDLGGRIRAARVAADMSQTDLAQAVGISFQQVQKCELGKDRVSASTLQLIAAALSTNPALYFDADASTPISTARPVRAAMAVAADWQRVESPEVRKQVAVLVAALLGGKEMQRQAPALVVPHPAVVDAENDSEAG